MLDIKTWLESNTNMKANEDCFRSPPGFPYLVFIDDTKYTGADNKNYIANRSIRVEMYSDKINKTAEQKVESLLNEKAVEFKRDRTWIDSQSFFMTVFEFNLVEKL